MNRIKQTVALMAAALFFGAWSLYGHATRHDGIMLVASIFMVVVSLVGAKSCLDGIIDAWKERNDDHD